MRARVGWGAVLFAPALAGCGGGSGGAGAEGEPPAVVAPQGASAAPRALVRWTGLT